MVVPNGVGEIVLRLAVAQTGGGAERQGIAVDPLRLVQGLIGGIGFLGAGAIIQSRGDVQGLTTAGSIWFVGALGLAAGGGYYLIASIAAAMALATLLALGKLAHAIQRRQGRQRGGGRGGGKEAKS